MEHPRILVVDDDTDTRLFLSDLLASRGYEVTAVAGTQEAFDELSKEQHALIVTDLKMPGLSGMELLHRIRSLRPEIPVLFYTAYANWPTFAKALRAGAVDMLQKPATETEILRAIQDALDRAPAMGRRAGKILVVEDDLDTLMMITQGLNTEGYAVELATNLGEAYRALERGGIRLVLLDVGLPGIDGFHGLFDIKHDARFRNVPVILVTARTEGFQEEKGRILGADAYIKKPFEWSELISTIQTHLSEKTHD
jgi:DNA-binding response OmpR family regulator